MSPPPVNDDPYQSFANEPLDPLNMEAVAANAEQDFDMNQVIRHNQYIGWVLWVIKYVAPFTLVHKGGNQIGIDNEALREITLVVPYPPEDWSP